MAIKTNPSATLGFTSGSTTVTVTGTNPILEGVVIGDFAVHPSGGLPIAAVSATTLTLFLPAPSTVSVTFNVMEGVDRALVAQATSTTRDVWAQIQAWSDRGIVYPVLAQQNAPPSSPIDRDRYLVGAAGSGAWSGRSNQIATWSVVAGGWLFTTPSLGDAVAISGSSIFLIFNGSAWQASALPDGSVSTLKIVDSAVTNAKMADMVASRVKGRAAGATTGAPVDLTPLQLQSIVGFYNTRALAAAATIDSTVSLIRIAGHTTAIDVGGASYARLGSAPSPSKAWHFQSADGAWWELAEREPTNAMFGGFAGADCTTAIQNCIDYQTARNGGVIRLTPGILSVSSALNITKGVVIQGAGRGHDGATHAGGTLLRQTVANTNVFNITCDGGITIRDMRIDANGVTATGGAAIRVAGGSSTTVNRGSLFENLTIVSTFVGIYILAGLDWTIENCFIQNFRSIGIYLEGGGFTGTTGDDSVGHGTICSCVIWAFSTSATAQACIRYGQGGDVRIVANKILGGQIGVWLTLANGPTGTLIIQGNSIEEQYINCLRFERSASTFANLIVEGNQIQRIEPAITSAGTAQATIDIAAGAAAWLTSATIANNSIYDTTNFSDAYHFIQVNAGAGVQVTGNRFNRGGITTGKGISVGGNASSVLIDHNHFLGMTTAKRYGSLTTEAVVIDMTGVTVADLPGTIRNGSRIYVTDGLFGSNPLSGSGSGTTAIRVNGAWVAGEGGLSTATASTSGTLANATDIQINLNARSFFPMIQNDGATAGGIALQGAISAGTADQPRFRIRNDSGSSRNYDVRWRYIN